jgi:hypothetical protein
MTDEVSNKFEQFGIKNGKTAMNSTNDGHSISGTAFINLPKFRSQ